MTDAAHLLTDFGSMMVSLFSLWISSRPPTKTMNFGWHRSGQDENSDASERMNVSNGDGREGDGWMSEGMESDWMDNLVDLFKDNNNSEIHCSPCYGFLP